MADDPRAVRLARRRMLADSKPKQKLTLQVRGFARKRGERIKKLAGGPPPLRLKVRK